MAHVPKMFLKSPTFSTSLGNFPTLSHFCIRHWMRRFREKDKVYHPTLKNPGVSPVCFSSWEEGPVGGWKSPCYMLGSCRFHPTDIGWNLPWTWKIPDPRLDSCREAVRALSHLMAQLYAFIVLLSITCVALIFCVACRSVWADQIWIVKLSCAMHVYRLLSQAGYRLEHGIHSTWDFPC